MRILHLNNHGSSVGGVEDYIREVADGLSDAGHSSHLVYFVPHNTDNLIRGATCIPMAAWPYSPRKVIQRIEETIAAFRPDVAYVHAVYHPDLVRWMAQQVTDCHICPWAVSGLSRVGAIPAPKRARLSPYGGGNLHAQRPN